MKNKKRTSSPSCNAATQEMPRTMSLIFASNVNRSDRLKTYLLNGNTNEARVCYINGLLI